MKSRKKIKALSIITISLFFLAAGKSLNISAETTEITEPAETTEITESAEATEITEPAEATEIKEPAETAEITEPAEATEIGGIKEAVEDTEEWAMGSESADETEGVKPLLEGDQKGVKNPVEGDYVDGYYVVNITASDLAGDAMCKAIQNALNEARDEASESKVYMIVVEPGNYELSTCLHIYSNTYLYVQGAVFRQSNYEGNMFKVGDIGNEGDTQTGYYYNNITLDGGVWDGKGTKRPIIRMAHGRNITVKNAVFQNVTDNHTMEVAGIDGFEVSNCTFRDQNISNKKDETLLANEAIQLDIMVEGHFSGYAYEKLVMKNVEITGNTFDNVARGVGSHTAWIGKRMENIRITNNIFRNIPSVAVECYNYSGCTISGNEIFNCGRGISVYALRSNGNGAYNAGKEGEVSLDAATVIENNKITVLNTDTYPPAGIEIQGINLKSDVKGSGDKIKAGNYYIKNITVRNNEIHSAGHGITAADARNIQITDNEVHCTAKSGSYYGIAALDESKDIGIKNNRVNSFPLNGIIADGKSSLKEINGNTISAAGGNGILVSGSDVYNIKDNLIYNPKKNGIYIYKAGSIGNVIYKNNIQNPGINGIAVENAAVKSIKSNQITKPKKHGILVYKSAKVSSTIAGNLIEAAAVDGISISTNANVKTVNTNTVNKSKSCGIHVTVDSKVSKEISGNKVSSSGTRGIYIYDNSGSAQITDNTVKMSGSQGINISSMRGTLSLEGNLISGSGDHGIYVKTPTKYKATVKKNTVKANKKKNGIQIKAGYVSIGGNTVSGALWPVNLEPGVKGSVSRNTLKSNTNNLIRMRGNKSSISVKNLGTPKLKAPKKTSAGIKLSWNKISGATGYEIYRSTSKNGSYTKVGSVSGKSLAFTDKKAKKGKKYYYEVRAVASKTGIKAKAYGNFSSCKAARL